MAKKGSRMSRSQKLAEAQNVQMQALYESVKGRAVLIVYYTDVVSTTRDEQPVTALGQYRVTLESFDKAREAQMEILSNGFLEVSGDMPNLKLLKVVPEKQILQYYIISGEESTDEEGGDKNENGT